MRCSMKVHNVQRALYVASYPWNKMAMRDKTLDNYMAENVVGWLLNPMFPASTLPGFATRTYYVNLIIYATLRGRMVKGKE